MKNLKRSTARIFAMVLFVATLLSLIISPLGSLLVVPELFLHLIKTIAYYFSLIPFGVFFDMSTN